MGHGNCLHSPEIITLCPKPWRLMSISPVPLGRRCTVALHSHRKAGWVSKFTCNVSLLLCSGSQPATLQLLFSQMASLPGTSLFFMPFTSLLFSKVRIKPTPTLRVGGRTSRQWHVTFLSFYRPNFSCFAKPFIFRLSEALYCAFWFGGGGGVMLVLIQGFIF